MLCHYLSLRNCCEYAILRIFIKKGFVFFATPSMGIPEFLDSGHKCWTLDSSHWTLDSGCWTLGAGLWMLDSGRWTLDAGPWTLKSRLWALDSGLWALDSDREDFKILICPKLWKPWRYIIQFILEFFIDENLWLF